MKKIYILFKNSTRACKKYVFISKEKFSSCGKLDKKLLPWTLENKLHWEFFEYIPHPFWHHAIFYSVSPSNSAPDDVQFA